MDTPLLITKLPKYVFAFLEKHIFATVFWYATGEIILDIDLHNHITMEYIITVLVRKVYGEKSGVSW